MTLMALEVPQSGRSLSSGEEEEGIGLEAAPGQMRCDAESGLRIARTGGRGVGRGVGRSGCFDGYQFSFVVIKMF